MMMIPWLCIQLQTPLTYFLFYQQVCGFHGLQLKYKTDLYVIHIIKKGLDVRKPVFRGLQKTKVQTSLCIHAVWSAPVLFALLKSILSKLAMSKISQF